MSERLTNIFGYMALLAILAAIWILFGETDNNDTEAEKQALFPDLEASIDTVNEISLSDLAAETTIRKDGDVWRIVSKDNYPASAPTVRRFLLQLLRAERLAPRTDDPALYSKIGLDEGALRVAISWQGTDVARLKIGNQKSMSEAFVIIGDETQSWLVEGISRVTTDINDWADTVLIPIAGADIASVTLTDGAMIQRDNSGVFTAVSGEDIVGFKGEGLVGSLSNLRFQDVKALANPLIDPVGQVTYKTYSGITVTLTLYEGANGLWSQASASWDEADISEGALISGGEDPATMATRLNAELEGWFFLIADNPTPPFRLGIEAFKAADNP